MPGWPRARQRVGLEKFLRALDRLFGDVLVDLLLVNGAVGQDTDAGAGDLREAFADSQNLRLAFLQDVDLARFQLADEGLVLGQDAHLALRPG
jgi:hypothetical protein